MEEKEPKQENKEKAETKSKSKKLIIIIASVILVIVIAVTGNLIFSSKNETKKQTGLSKKEYIINENEAKQLKLVDYDGGNFTMKIPEGWKVETGGIDMYYAIRAYNPNDDRYQVFAILKAYPFLKNDKAKNWYENYYNSFGGAGNKVLAKALVLQPTVEAFYSRFNEYVNYIKEVDTIYNGFNSPDLRSFSVLEEFESNSSLKGIAKDDKTIRGTFQDTETGKQGEGLFMASIIDSGSYMPLGYDVLFYTAYNVMGISTAKDDLINYQAILTESLSSIVYTDSFINTTIANGEERTKNALAINASMQETFNSYNSAWSARQKTYDITSQKYSDATLGYERVYDTDTGEVYKAYNGFTDDYDGNRYQTITDDMYTQSVSGYIEKVN